MAKKEQSKGAPLIDYPASLVKSLADEVANIVISRLPNRGGNKTKTRKNGKLKLDNGLFLDTSAIIDGRIFEVIRMGFHTRIVVIIEEVLRELKHIADSQDAVKRERGRRGLELLEKLKKQRDVKIINLSPSRETRMGNRVEVDEELVRSAKQNRGRVVTCDYNLEKKAAIQGVKVVNVNALAQALKVAAVPGESLHIKILHGGKDPTQGVGYLDDGTMIVVEKGSDMLDKTVDVVVSRVIQTAAGRILFAKKI
jgi:uncharacterized protein YacL